VYGCFLFLLFSYAGKRKLQHETYTATVPKSLYQTLKPWLGVPYRAGGQDDRGVDCSGFTCAVYRDHFHQKLPRTVKEQWAVCERINQKKIREGDLVFFAPGKTGVSHVGIYLNDSLFIHSSSSKGVVISHLNQTYYRKSWVGAGRPGK